METLEIEPPSRAARIPAGTAKYHAARMLVTAGMSLLALATAVAALAAPPPPADPPMALPTIPPATLDDALEVTGESVDARVIRTRMAIDVRVNGQGPFRFVVDSGADRSVIGMDLARRLALPAEPPVTLHDMAGTSRVATVRLENLKVGESEIAGIVAPALPERYLGAQGLLGIDALAEQRLMLDFEKKTITVQDSRKPAVVRADEIVVTARRRNGQLILTQVNLAGRQIYAVIDSGAQVTIGNMALLARVLRGRMPPPAMPVTLTSVTGRTIAATMIVVPAITIGKVTLKQVPVAFADAPPFALFGLAREPALLFGTDLLEAFRRVSLDFRNRKVRFVLRR